MKKAVKFITKSVKIVTDQIIQSTPCWKRRMVKYWKSKI